MEGRGGSPARGDMGCDAAFPTLVCRPGPQRSSPGRQGERASGPDFGTRSPSWRFWPSPDAGGGPPPLRRPHPDPLLPPGPCRRSPWPWWRAASYRRSTSPMPGTGAAGSSSWSRRGGSGSSTTGRCSRSLSGPLFPESSPTCRGRRAGPPERGVPSGVRSETVFLRELHQDPGRRHGGRPLPRLRRRCERGRSRERGSDPDHPPAVREPQRGTARLRPRRVPLHRDGGRGLGRGPVQQRAEPRRPSRETSTDRRGVGRGPLRSSPDQPVPGHDQLPPGDLGARTPKPVAILLRPRDGGPLYRRRGARELRGDRRPAGRKSRGAELRLEHHGRRQLLPPRDRRLQPNRPCPPGLRVRSLGSGAP